MPEYPQLARDITALRKIGDIDGAIARFRAAPENERKLPEVRSAAAWVVYERDIKPISPAAQREDQTLQVTDKMLTDALLAVEKIKTWCRHDLHSSFSAYPTSLLMVAKALKARKAHEQLQTLLESVDASQFSTTSSGPYQSAQSQWVNLALDAVKHLFAAADLTEQRILRAEGLLTQLQKIDKNGGLSRETPNFNTNGQSRKLPSQKQRFVLQYTKFLQELGRFDELAKQCKAAIESGLFYRNSNLKWILYRLTLALKDSNPKEALKACDDFVALEERSYSLLLRAEILLACGDRQGALREAVHSLQKVIEKDLRFITKNLRFVAALTDDIEVKKLHIQMVRFVRYEQGQKPQTELEIEARELNLPQANEAPSFDALQAMWHQINPNTERRRTIGRAVLMNVQKETHTIQTERFVHDQSRLGEVIMAKIPTKSGEEKYRPVVVIGQNGNQLLVGPLQVNSKHRKAVDVSDWVEAGLKQSSVFVPFWHIVPNAGQKVLGKLSANDKAKITGVIKRTQETSSRPNS